MQDLWHIAVAPLWLANDFLSGTIGGFMGQGRDGVLSICWAIPPDQDVVQFRRLLPQQPSRPPDAPRTSTATFAVDCERHELKFLHEVADY
jgi:hypothetical protein